MIERWGIYALFGSLDPDRYAVTVELFAILSELARPKVTPAELNLLGVRALRTLIELEDIGPLQVAVVMCMYVCDLQFSLSIDMCSYSPFACIVNLLCLYVCVNCVHV